MVKRYIRVTCLLFLLLMAYHPVMADSRGPAPVELGNAAVRAVEKYPIRSFYAQAYDLLYTMKPSTTKTALLRKMQNLKTQVDAEQIVRAQEGVQFAEAYPDTASYNKAIHRIEKVESDEVQLAMKTRLREIVKVSYKDIWAFPKDFSPTQVYGIEQAVSRAESNKSEPYLSEGDEAVRNLPYGKERTDFESRMKVAHKSVDEERIDQALKCVDMAAVLDEESYTVIAMDAIGLIADDSTRTYLEKRLFQFKVRSSSRSNLVPYLENLKMPLTIKTSGLKVGNALNALLIAEVKPTKVGVARAADAIGKLQDSIEKDFLLTRLMALQ